MESWNHSFKVEAIHGEKLTTRALTKNHVFEYIEIYYNRKRLHSTIGYKTPESFEVKMVLSNVSDFPGQDQVSNSLFSICLCSILFLRRIKSSRFAVTSKGNVPNCFKHSDKSQALFSPLIRV